MKPWRIKPCVCIVAILLIPLMGYGLSSDSQLPARISSDSASYDNNQHLSIYRGHVIIKQGSTELRGDVVMIYSMNNNQKISKLIAIGKPASYQTLPDNQINYLYAKAERIEYYPLKHYVLLIHNGYIAHNNNSFAGAKIKYLIDKQTIISEAATHQDKTKIVLQPQQ